jgi:hypothetical protein
MTKIETGSKQTSCNELLDKKAKSISRILEKHLDEYDREIKDLVMSGRTSDRYLELPVGKREALRNLKEELIKEKLIC